NPARRGGVADLASVTRPGPARSAGRAPLAAPPGRSERDTPVRTGPPPSRCGVPSGRSARGQESSTLVLAALRTLLPSQRTVRFTTTTLPGSFFSTAARTSTSAPDPSFGTTTGEENFTPYSRIAPGSPAQSVTTRPAVAIVSIPWAITPGSPTSAATFS